ncbi:MAG: Gfo/Idh/MocA family oxidoreductase [Eubacteriales bacterium]|nr:Gfo/Idh/MocA family oxidoreductase [Eubacteriales bacterium]
MTSNKELTRKPLRVAIIGCGGMGGGHALAIASGSGQAVWNAKTIEDCRVAPDADTTDISGLLELAGICDINPVRQAWAAEKGIHVYESFEAELNDPTVDIILIATPNHLHKDEAIAALRAGKHVLCEKPVTPTSAELLEILAVAAETGKVFYPRQNRRWDKDYLICKQLYEQKTIGELFGIECRVMGSRGIPGDWRRVKAYGGGMLLDWGIHLLDRILVMVPEKVKDVYCHEYYEAGLECDDGFQMQLTFESGLTATLEVGTCHFINHPLWYVAGKQGTAVIEDWDCNGRIVRPLTVEERDAQPIVAGAGLTKTMAPRSESGIVSVPLPELHFDRNALYANLVAVVRGEAEQIVTGEQALRTLRVLEAAHESASKGVVVAFNA